MKFHANASVCEILKYYSFLQYLSDNNTSTATLLFVTDLHLQTACEYVSIYSIMMVLV